MKNISLLLTCLILTSWISAIAILSVQNAIPVSLTFLGFRSIEMPLGIVLAFSGGVGIMGGAIVQLLANIAAIEYEEVED